MPESLGWNFPIDESDQWDGFNHPGIEYYRGNPLFHVARETIQNAVDAADDGEVEVRFRLKQVETASLPNLAQLKETMKSCLNAAEDESEKARVFFKNAKKMLEQNHLPVLEVSELNTTGIKGPPVNGSPF
jgi:hypothetical protein